jgi:hypothetical protein
VENFFGGTNFKYAFIDKFNKPKKMNNDKLKKIADRLSVLKLDAESAQNTMGAFKDKAGSALTDLALTHFRALNDMNADAIRKFGQIISEYSRSLAEDLNKLNYKAKNEV